ncbi:SH3 domain-containing protein [Tropicimonas sediminicola]|uniref:SH3 domain-containing protein n=1 Tax=Tropicimonas sediminicola TaxID=1031541 RepID=A0A239I588_9RHOB|nr:SH3 domain-containing protein [Tropicimonas sediminicola]SNS88458.1 SH3 domain-containing protein [Tropicimonas sediminicola]
MLGRYVATTLTVLGFAMLVADDDTAPGPSLSETPLLAQFVERADSRSAWAAPVSRAAFDPAELAADNAEADAPIEIASADLPEEMVLLASAGAPAEPADRLPARAAQAPAASAGATPAATPDADLLQVLGNRVNLRAGPSTRHPVVGSAGRGEKVELVAYEGPDWAHIRLSDGETGFMSRRFLVRAEAVDG